MSPAMQAICRRLGRRPLNETELTDAERRALAAEDVERRDGQPRPIEKREDSGMMERRSHKTPMEAYENQLREAAREDALASGRSPTVPATQREGKVLSAANEALLREAYGAIADAQTSHAAIGQHHADLASALEGLAASSKREAEPDGELASQPVAVQRAVQACLVVLEDLRARRGFKRYREGLWDQLFHDLERLGRAAMPPSVRKAYADLERIQAVAGPPVTYVGNIELRVPASGDVVEVPAWKLSVQRQKFAQEAAAARRRIQRSEN